MHLARLLILLLLAMAAAPGLAAGRTHLAVSLHSESDSPAPGRATRIALKFVPEPGWHGYWSNPGDSGLAPKVRWSAPDGVRFGPLRHPAPELLEVAGMASFVHSGQHVLLTEMRLPAGLAAGTRLPVRARLEWLACTDRLCVPERADLALELEVGDGRAGSGRQLFRTAAAAMPKTAPAGASYSAEGGGVILRLPVELDPQRARFFPDSPGILDATLQSARASGEGIEISMRPVERLPDPLTGVVSDGRRSWRVRARPSPSAASPPSEPAAAADSARPVLQATASDPAAAGPASPARDPERAPAAAAPAAPAGFLVALAGALLGGLLLNLMPCVFPVLSLKALSLARANGPASEARKDALGYLAGTVATALLLGSILIGLRTAGAEIGWSFQLQSPWVVLALLVVVMAVAANLAGLFEIRGPSWSSGAGGGGAMRSVATGALSAIIATPCSAPFMASALGAALVLPPAQALAVFAGLGIGLGLPFVLIGFVPALRQRLPRPGPWMETLRRALAMPMALTAVWLLWVLGRQAGVDAMTASLLLLTLLGAALAWVGHRQRRNRARAWLPLAPLAAAAAGLLLLAPISVEGREAAKAAPTGSFSAARLAQLRAEGRPVFVDFTADWCLACKVNEQIAIDRSATREAFSQVGVVTLVGDWTRGDPEITRFLAAHGRNSIPFYLFYAPGREPKVLPQVLTPGLLQGLAKQAGRDRAESARSPVDARSTG